MTANNPVHDLLAAPLNSDWTVEGLAEQLLGIIATEQPEDEQEFVFDGNAARDGQSRRILRPLLACLAIKSAAETGTPVNLYGGRLSFQRAGSEGPVWILGEFENHPGSARLAWRRSAAPQEAPGPRKHRASELSDANAAVTSPESTQPQDAGGEQSKSRT